jgi:hypothetical protein
MSRLQNTTGNPACGSAFSRVQTMTTANPALRALSEAEDAPRPSVAFLELQNHFYLHLQIIRDSIFDALVAGGYYENRPDRVRLLYVAKGLLVGLLLANLFDTCALLYILPWVFRTELVPDTECQHQVQ